MKDWQETIIATIEKVKKVSPHPNLKDIEIIEVAGKKSYVIEGKYKKGEWCALLKQNNKRHVISLDLIAKRLSFAFKHRLLDGDIKEGYNISGELKLT